MYLIPLKILYKICIYVKPMYNINPCIIFNHMHVHTLTKFVNPNLKPNP